MELSKPTAIEALANPPARPIGRKVSTGTAKAMGTSQPWGTHLAHQVWDKRQLTKIPKAGTQATQGIVILNSAIRNARNAKINTPP